MLGLGRGGLGSWGGEVVVACPKVWWLGRSSAGDGAQPKNARPLAPEPSQPKLQSDGLLTSASLSESFPVSKPFHDGSPHATHFLALHWRNGRLEFRKARQSPPRTAHNWLRRANSRLCIANLFVRIANLLFRIANLFFLIVRLLSRIDAEALTLEEEEEELMKTKEMLRWEERLRTTSPMSTEKLNRPIAVVFLEAENRKQFVQTYWEPSADESLPGLVSASSLLDLSVAEELGSLLILGREAHSGGLFMTESNAAERAKLMSAARWCCSSSAPGARSSSTTA